MLTSSFSSVFLMLLLFESVHLHLLLHPRYNADVESTSTQEPAINMPPSRMPPRVQEISNIQLPSKIKCSRCKTAKTPAFFSDKKLNDLKQEILTKRMRGQSFDAATALLVPCKACTSGNITELLCAGCKSLPIQTAEWRLRSEATC